MPPNAPDILDSESDDRYEILERLGSGGMGAVYRVLDRALDEEIALKLLKPELNRVTDAVRNFKQEVRLARRINHPNVVRVFHFFLWRNHLAITQELISGGSLTLSLGRRPLPNQTLLRITRCIASALHAAHEQGIAHLDLKPANIMMDRKQRPVVVDFGLARLAGAQPRDKPKRLMGTPGYMSPEQITNHPAVDYRSDIYSLAVLVFRLATGRLLYPKSGPVEMMEAQLSVDPPRLSSLRPDLPPAVDDVLLRALERNPDKRHDSTLALYHELAAAFPTRWAGRDAEPSARSGKKVLVVDDDPSSRLLIRAQLHKLEILVLEAADGHEAIATVRRERPALVLLDIKMPELDGRETLKILKSQPDTARTPVVMLTGSTDDQEVIQSKDLGAAAFLNKPIQFDVLELLMQRYLD